MSVEWSPDFISVALSHRTEPLPQLSDATLLIALEARVRSLEERAAAALALFADHEARIKKLEAAPKPRRKRRAKR